MNDKPSFVDRGLGEDIAELKGEIARLKELTDKVTLFQLGDRGLRADRIVKVVKEGDIWVVSDGNNRVLREKGRFRNRDEALKRAIEEFERRAQRPT